MRLSLALIVGFFAASIAEAQTFDDDLYPSGPAALMRPPIAMQFAGTATGPLIEDDAGTVCHAWWNGSAIQDTEGCSWTQNGTVPQVSTSPFYPAGFGGSAKAGAGPFSDTNYYSLGASNPTDASGDFMEVFVYNVTSGAATSVLYSNAVAATSGWWVSQAAGAGAATITFENGGGTATTGNSGATNGPQVLCVGRSGTTASIRLNGATVVTGAVTATAATAAAELGRKHSAGAPFTGVLYEALFEGTAYSDTTCTRITNRVLGQTGSFGEGLAVTRATTATDVIGGVVYTFPANVARTDANGLLSEAAATNLALQNTAIDNAAWTKLATGTGSAPTISADATAAPDLTTTADNVVYPLTTTSTAGSVVQMPFTGTAAAYSASVWLKKSAGSGNVFLSLNTGGASFSRTNCAITTAWSYCTLPNITLTAATWNLEVGVDSRDASQTGQAAQTVAVWGAQAEMGAFPTSMIYTAGTSGTRNADAITVSNPLTVGDTNWCVDFTVTPGPALTWETIAGYIQPWQTGIPGAGPRHYATVYVSSGVMYYDLRGADGVFREIGGAAHGFTGTASHRLTACATGTAITLYKDGVQYATQTGIDTAFDVAGSTQDLYSVSYDTAGYYIKNFHVCRTSDSARCQ